MTQNILFIGGNGFIGTNLVACLIETKFLENHRLVILSRNHLPLIRHPNIENIKGDINNKDFLIFIFQKYRFLKVFHFASSTVPLNSNLHITDSINTELVGIVNLLEIMCLFNCKFLLYLSTGGALYGNQCPPNGCRETDTCNPISSYGILKWANEQYIQLFQKKYGINYLILRPSNLYGEYHQSDLQGIINIAIRKAILREKLEIWGDGNQEKDYLYVKDAAKILLQLLLKGTKNQILNLGSGKQYSINNVVSVIRAYENELDIVYKDKVVSDTPRSFLDITQLLKHIKNVEFTKIEEGIMKTYLWEKKNIKIQNKNV